MGTRQLRTSRTCRNSFRSRRVPARCQDLDSYDQRTEDELREACGVSNRRIPATGTSVFSLFARAWQKRESLAFSNLSQLQLTRFTVCRYWCWPLQVSSLCLSRSTSTPAHEAGAPLLPTFELSPGNRCPQLEPFTTGSEPRPLLAHPTSRSSGVLHVIADSGLRWTIFMDIPARFGRIKPSWRWGYHRRLQRVLPPAAPIGGDGERPLRPGTELF